MSARVFTRADLRPAVESAPGVARTRPMAPRDRGSIRKVAISGSDARRGHRRPSALYGGSPANDRLQACAAGELCHQFAGSGCHAGCGVLSYGRTPVESAPGWSRCLVGLNGPSISALTRSVRRPPKVGPRDRKAAREPDLRVRLATGVTTNAAMVDGLPNSTLDERHLDCKCLRRRQMRSLMQVRVLEKVVET